MMATEMWRFCVVVGCGDLVIASLCFVFSLNMFYFLFPMRVQDSSVS